MNYSTAAGAYQFLYKTWVLLAKSENLPDFSPDSQDKAAVALIRNAGALDDVEAGDLQPAVDKCSHIWASLPSSKYPQPKRSFEFFKGWYEQSGGQLKEIKL
jgi:lysozyme